MQTLETIARRIDTTQDLRSIVRTMKSLSAVSIRRYEIAAAAIAEYHETVELGLQVVLRAVQLADAGPPRGTVSGPTAAIVFGTDYGLCGRFNEQIADFAISRLESEGVSQDDRIWLVIGARARARLAALGEHPSAQYAPPSAASGLNKLAGSILIELDRLQSESGVSRALVFFNLRGKFGLAQPHLVHLLPVDPRYLRALARRPWKSRRLPAFTMKPDRLFASLIRQHLFVALFRAGAESSAAEHSARLLATQEAERNIANKLEEMSADYRQQRQAVITAEILDIIAGYEAVTHQRKETGAQPDGARG